MSYSQNKFDKAIWDVVSAIKPGQVLSYGEVARAAGYPRHARMVSHALSRASIPLPWFRVIKSDRTLAFDSNSDAYKLQRRLLKKDGVEIVNGKVVSSVNEHSLDLDALLWRPPES